MYQKEISGVINNVIHTKEVDSTNNQAKEAGNSGAPGGILFIADRQTDGRGRRGRNWQSSDSDGLWMSILLRPEIAPESASMLTLVAAMAVAETVRKVTKADCQIKWPNDIVSDGRKLCGILTEMSAKPGIVDYVVIGIGINVNTEAFDDSIKDMATSLYMETGDNVDKARLVGTFSKEFTRYYEEFLKTCDMSRLSEEYNQLLVNVDRLVTVEQNDGRMLAKALGIDDTGALVVEKTDGTLLKIIAGEVSVRGLYGYV